MEIKLTEEQRREFLQCHNDLHQMLHTIWETNDLWMSDVAKLEKLKCLLHQTLQFMPKRDSDGHSMYYADWMLAEDVEEKPKAKRGRPKAA
jgi:hypothetical protein